MTGFFIVAAVVLILILAAVALLGAARRRDASAAVGSLSHETVKRDKAARKTEPLPVDAVPPTGREIERSAALERRGGEIEKVGDRAPAVWTPPDIETFGVAVVGFLWPSSTGGFGSKLNMGKITDLKADVEKGNGFLYRPEGRMWITEYPATALPKAEAVYSAPELTGMKAGLVALYQKCPHLGCRVPSCNSSQWFECPCHGSQYNQVGEKKGGPAPRGMDRFAMEVAGGVLTVNTGLILQGPPIGTNTTGQEAEGPHCVGGGHH